jgi:hypothetical protein
MHRACPAIKPVVEPRKNTMSRGREFVSSGSDKATAPEQGGIVRLSRQRTGAPVDVIDFPTSAKVWVAKNGAVA